MQFFTEFYELERNNVNKPYKSDLFKHIKRRNMFVAILSGITIIFFVILMFIELLVMPVIILNLFVPIDGFDKTDSIGLLGLCLFIFIGFIFILACAIVGMIGALSPKNTILYGKYSNIAEIIKRNTNKNENSYVKEEWEYPIRNFDFNTMKECFQRINCWGNINYTFLCNHPVGTPRFGYVPVEILLFNQFDNNICIIPLVKKSDGNIKAYLDLSTVISINNISKIKIIKNGNSNTYSLHISLRKREWNLFYNWYNPYYHFMVADNLSSIFQFQEKNLKEFTEMWNNK